MRRALLALTVAIGLTLVAPAPVLAGGSWMEWEAEAFAPGQIASGHGTFSDGCCSRGTPEDGPYFAYLTPHGSYDGIPPLPDEAINVAPLSITEKGPLWDATVSFIVPDVPTGYYMVHLCNDPCTELLGDSIGNGFMIVAGAERAAVYPMIRRLRETVIGRSRLLRARMVKLERRLQAVESAADKRIDELVERVSELQKARATGPETPSEPTAALLLGAAGLGAIAWFVRRSR